jgi:pyruvate dehydrogenase E1 component
LFAAGQDTLPHATALIAPTEGPVLAASDYVRAVPESIRAAMPAGRRYATLGTDGFGRSDSRAALRQFFEVDRYWIAAHALRLLAADGALARSVVDAAIERYGLADRGVPWQR